MKDMNSSGFGGAGVLLCFLALLAGTGCGGRQSTESSAIPYVRVSPRDPRYFEFSDGTPFVPIGLNIAFPRFLYDEKAVMAKMEERMRKLSANGGNTIRVWMSHPFYDVEHERAGTFDSMKVRRINHILALAREYHIRVVLTFEHFQTLEEEPPKFPGAPAMGDPVYAAARGGPAENMTAFFTQEKARAVFREKLDWFARRYREEPVVFAWELWNEIDTVRGDGWMEWSGKMLEELHRKFPHQLAFLSVGSLDMIRKRELYPPVWKLAGNDFTDVHRFLDEGAQLKVCQGPVDVMAADAVREVASLNLGKPVMLGQTGAVEAGHAGPSKLYERDRLGIILHDVMFAPFFAGAAGPGEIWHWYSYVDKHDLWYHFGRFADLIQGLDPPAEGFVPGKIEHPRLRVCMLRGRKTFLAWCRDNNDDWRSELQEGKEPRVIGGAVLDFSQLEAGAPVGSWRVYNPWSGQWYPAKIRDGKLALPKFLRSIVVRVDG